MFKILYEIRVADIFTFLNLFFGFAGIMYLFQDIYTSIQFLFIAALMDGADGFIASRVGEGSLGKILDSLADVVSFGVLPALMISLAGYIWIALIFLLTGIVRLARFSILKRENFVGYPITSSALMIASMFYLDFHINIIAGVGLVLSLFMLSDIEYIKIKDKVILFVVAVVIISTFIVKDAAYVILTLTLLYIVSPFPWRFSRWFMERRLRRLSLKRV
jgi:CDP-diacylglycerol--serine O-phosphatidyltransferase